MPVTVGDPPCGADNPGGVQLTAMQNSLLGGASFQSLSTAQQQVFLTITADAAQLGLNLSGYTFGSISIAGVSGATQTEFNLTAANGNSSLNSLTSSFGESFSPAGSDPMHGVYNVGNWRQNVAQWSTQITSAANGNIQIDIDPFNPNKGGIGAWFGHASDVVWNTLTRSDTSYTRAAAALQARSPGLKVFKCP